MNWDAGSWEREGYLSIFVGEVGLSGFSLLYWERKRSGNRDCISDLLYLI
jgi:hypothetical protein